MRIPQALMLTALIGSFVLNTLSGQEQAVAPAESEIEVREQTVYIPYTELKALFEKEGRGVFLPYEEFQTLWEAARANSSELVEVKPPLGSLITEVDSKASLNGDVMTVEAKMSVELLTEGWHEIPLRLNQAAIRKITVDNAPARVLYSAKTGYTLLLQNPAQSPLVKELRLVYGKAYEQSPGKNHVEFLAPQAPINRWRIQVPDQGVEIEVQPNIANEKVTVGETDGLPEGLESQNVDGQNPTSVVQAFVGAANLVKIDWTAKAEGAAGLSALVTVENRQQVTIQEGVIRTRALMNYDISRAEIDTIEIQVPSDHNVVNVFDPNLKKWEKTLDGDVQTLALTLFQPTRGIQPVALELEKFAGGKAMSRPMMQTEIVSPVIRATRAGKSENLLAVGRQQGIVVIKIGNTLRGETVSRTGLTQIDPSDLPAELAQDSWTYAYRYASVPYDLRLSVEKLLPDIEVVQLAEVGITPEKFSSALTALYNISQTGVYQLQVEIPAGYTVRSVQGVGQSDYEPFVVESFDFQKRPASEAEGTEDQILLVNLGRRALGKFGLAVNIDKVIKDPNLGQPTGEVSELVLPVPRVQPESVDRGRGNLLIYATENLRLSPSDLIGVSPVSEGSVGIEVPSQRGNRFLNMREIGAYAFTKQDVDVNFVGQRRKPYIEARQFLGVNVESGTVEFISNFQFDVQYSGVVSLRVDVPQSIADRLRNDSESLTEQLLDPQPSDIAEGYVAWSLVGDKELLGPQSAVFTWEFELGDLPVGQATPIEVARLIPQGVDRSWGQLVASKAETIEIGVSSLPRGLRPIDPQRDLFDDTQAENAARAFEYYGDWSLTLQATRYELEEVKRTSIDRALIRVVQTRSQEVSVQAIYRIRSARQRIAVIIPGVNPNETSGALDSQPLRINGQPALLEHDGNQFFIPFTGFTPDDAVMVELRYTLPSAKGAYEIPHFPEEPAVQQVHLAYYLPDDRTLLFKDGPWSEVEEVGFFDTEPNYEVSDEFLIEDLRNPTACPPVTGMDFPVDGRRYLFSTLRPEAGAEGALRLTAMKELFFHASIVVLVGFIGIGLCLRPWETRLWWIAMVVVIIVMTGVFAPRFALAIFQPPFFVSFGLVIGLWAVQGTANFVPKVNRWLVGNLKSIPSPAEHSPDEQSPSENTPPEDFEDEADESPSMVETELKSQPIEEKMKDEQGGEEHE